MRILHYRPFPKIVVARLRDGIRQHQVIRRILISVRKFQELLLPAVPAFASVEVQSIYRLTRTVPIQTAHRQEIERCV